MAIDVKAPDLNISFGDFRPIDNKSISYGLNAIKNVGAKALETIMQNVKKMDPMKQSLIYAQK